MAAWLPGVWLLCSCVCGGLVASAQGQFYADMRGAVQKTDDDLQRVREKGPRDKKELNRIDEARKHLSDFDRDLTKNKFNKGKLNAAIDNVKHVLEHNTLDARDRDALTVDIENLRRDRETRGR
jgi:predicted  nucleic acid-binding Zn-ribbon protein